MRRIRVAVAWLTAPYWSRFETLIIAGLVWAIATGRVAGRWLDGVVLAIFMFGAPLLHLARRAVARLSDPKRSVEGR